MARYRTCPAGGSLGAVGAADCALLGGLEGCPGLLRRGEFARRLLGEGVRGGRRRRLLTEERAIAPPPPRPEVVVGAVEFLPPPAVMVVAETWEPGAWMVCPGVRICLPVTPGGHAFVTRVGWRGKL